MKIIFFLFFILILQSSCSETASKKKLTQKSKKELSQEEKRQLERYVKMSKSSKELINFKNHLVKLYDKSITNPREVIISADSLLKLREVEKDPIKLSFGINSELNYLKGEIFYKQGEYKKSIKELSKNEWKHMDLACALAANYIKLKQYKIARAFVDSIQKSTYIYDYALGNYYESVGNKTAALKIYEDIKQDKRFMHYAYYKLTLKRIEDINLNNHLLNEIYFPPGNPNFQISDSK